MATRVGPIPEIIEDGQTGMLVSARSPRELALAIVEVAGNPELQRRLGENASHAARERFSIGRSVAQLEDVYQRVLGGERARAPAAASR